MKFQLYVCGREFGCNVMKEFESDSDQEAAKIANNAINGYEQRSGDYIYREYLYEGKVTDDDPREIEI